MSLLQTIISARYSQLQRTCGHRDDRKDAGPYIGFLFDNRGGGQYQPRK